MTQTLEKWDSHVLSGPDFWMVWRCHGILCIYVYFSFFFKSNVRRGYLDESDFRHCFGNCFESAIPKVSWSQLITTITSSQQLQNNIDNSILKSILEFTDMDQGTCYSVHQDFSKYNVTRINEGALKIITRKKIPPRTSKSIAPK